MKFIQKTRWGKRRVCLGPMTVAADRWPWQEGYGWKGSDHRAPLNMSGARFGGGWKFCLGVRYGSTTVMLELLFGTMSFAWGNHQWKGPHGSMVPK